MSNLAYRQSKIQEARKQTPRRDFVMEIGSWQSVTFYKYGDFISRYPQTDRIATIINTQEFEKKVLDGPLSISDYHGDFLDDFGQLVVSNGLPNLHQSIHTQNSEYTDCSGSIKNCYLSFITSSSENVLYSFSIKTNISNVISCVAVRSNCDNIFESFYVTNSSNIFYSQGVHNCYNLWFCENMTGCQNCILCSNLENKSYYINNQEYSKEEYESIATSILSQKELFADYKNKLGNQLSNVNSDGSQGNGLFSTDQLTNGLICASLERGNNVIMSGGESLKTNYFDVFCGGKGDNCYGVFHAANRVDNVYCSALIYDSSFIFYSYYLDNCSFCLGCVGLRNKSYCILNKQYTKEEWYEKVDEIFSQMNQDGTLGQFFPASMNPFYFNDTAAYLIDPSFTKEEVTAAGYLWRDEPIKVDIPEWMEVVESKDLDKFEAIEEGVWVIDPIILKKTIRDEEGNVYCVIKLEYDFLVKYGLPLPRKHWLTRMKENFRIS